MCALDFLTDRYFSMRMADFSFIVTAIFHPTSRNCNKDNVDHAVRDLSFPINCSRLLHLVFHPEGGVAAASLYTSVLDDQLPVVMVRWP